MATIRDEITIFVRVKIYFERVSIHSVCGNHTRLVKWGQIDRKYQMKEAAQIVCCARIKLRYRNTHYSKCKRATHWRIKNKNKNYNEIQWRVNNNSPIKFSPQTELNAERSKIYVMTAPFWAWPWGYSHFTRAYLSAYFPIGSKSTNKPC